ncbi:hypothetical protein LTR08_004956 [Meristemomyces frigidus]|nr:hypothetical protein LTR08_004956 [Meristemomyces frigidus]
MLSRRAAARHHGFSPTATLRRARAIHTATVTDADIARLAAKPLHPLTLADLCRHGRPPLSQPALLASANFTLGLLPARLAHRIQSLRRLPYIVVANPHVGKIHANYLHSLGTLLPYAERRIETLQEEVQFTEVMADLVQTHSNTIGTLARGFLEARKYISAPAVTRFLDEHLRARIGTRLIAEQHIALHYTSLPHTPPITTTTTPHAHTPPPATPSTYIGVIDTALNPLAIIRACEATVGEICELHYGVRPTILVTNAADPPTSIAHIPMHVEYILTELLKNSFRATIEAGMAREPIEITIAPAPEREQLGDEAEAVAGGGGGREEEDILPLAHQRTPGLTLRIRDRGGGISAANYAKLWDYGFTTFNEDEISEKVSPSFASSSSGVSAGLDFLGAQGGGSTLAGLGYGLPLGRAYAEYFGGGVAVQSLWGWGTDVYLGLRGVGKVG